MPIVPADFNPVVAIGLSLVPVMFAYSGWQTSTFMAGEMRESNRSLPIGILVGVLGVIVLYLAMNAGVHLRTWAGTACGAR